jgi:hypothetical protein
VVDETFKTLRTPSFIPLKITSVEPRQHRRRRFYRVKKIQKKGIPNLITPLSTTTQFEESKDSPSPKGLQGSKGKSTQ